MNWSRPYTATIAGHGALHAPVAAVTRASYGPDARAALTNILSGDYLVWTLALSILVATAVVLGWPAGASVPNPQLRQVVADSLSHDGVDGTARVVRTNVTALGDVEVEFAIQEYGDAEADHTAALADALAIAHAVYTAPEPRPATVTLLAVRRSEPPTTSAPLLYVSLPADRLVGRDWTRLQAGDLATVGVVRWLH